VVDINEIVIVALEAVAITVNGDDAVHEDGIHLFAVVGHHVTDAVFVGLSDDGQVPGMEAGLHADAMGDDVGGAAAHRGGQQPRHGREGNNGQ